MTAATRVLDRLDVHTEGGLKAVIDAVEALTPQAGSFPPPPQTVLTPAGSGEAGERLAAPPRPAAGPMQTPP